MPLFQVPAQTQPAPEAPLPLATALARILDEYDLKGEGGALSAPPVRPGDAPALKWLMESLTRDLPDNPFPKGSPSHGEAEALRTLLQVGEAGVEARLARLALGEVGTQMALWRWGRRLERAGRLSSSVRLAWEDALLAVPSPTLATSYALRHSLSFALAAGDLDRFGRLKAAHARDAADTVLEFQRLFGLIGTLGPGLHLWALPGLRSSQLHLKDLGGERIWISPADPEQTSNLPTDVAWIIPSMSGSLEEAAAALDDPSRKEAEQLARRFTNLGQRIWFAPSRADFEAYGLTFFPVLIRIDFRGSITSIQMGEAAPRRP